MPATNWECYATRVGGRRREGLFQPTPTVSPLQNPPEPAKGAMDATGAALDSGLTIAGMQTKALQQA